MQTNFPFSNVSNVQSVVTASRAATALFLSASVSSSVHALFPKGPTGPAGPTLDVDGIQGAPGTFGPSGSAGLGALLLSSSRAKCQGECFTVDNATGGALTVSWTDLNNVGRSGSVPASTTYYICSVGTPTGASLTITPSGTPCIQLVTTIDEVSRHICAV